MKSNSTIDVMSLTKAIKPKQTYGPAELTRLGTFPWARHQRSIIKLIDQDLTLENILQAKVTGEGRQRRYEIEGKNIIKYLNKYAAVLMSTARKPKNYDREK